MHREVKKKRQNRSNKKGTSRLEATSGITPLRVRLLALILLILLLFAAGREPVSADLVYYDAMSFYQKYGSEAIFLPTTEEDGMICFATRASTSGGQYTSFSTEGWELEFKDLSGNVLQRFRMKLGGNWLTILDEMAYGDTVYRVYSIMLSDLKSLRNAVVVSAMEQGQCYITMNACLVVKRNGIPSGSMETDGSISGTVYTTYPGIVSAAGWTPDNREYLKSYFGKEIKGLFHKVTLQGDDGIGSVGGNGAYCYGSYAEITVQVQEHFEFLGWFETPDDQTPIRTEQSFSVRANSDLHYYARSKSNHLPQIHKADRYYTLEDAESGRITEDEIRKHIRAYDEEDGALSESRITIEGVDTEQFKNAENGDQMIIQITAADSDGNCVSSEMVLTLVEAVLHKKNRAGGDLRFISPAYPESIEADSIWRTDPDYVKLLERAGIFQE